MIFNKTTGYKKMQEYKILTDETKHRLEEKVNLLLVKGRIKREDVIGGPLPSGADWCQAVWLSPKPEPKTKRGRKS